MAVTKKQTGMYTLPNVKSADIYNGLQGLSEETQRKNAQYQQGYNQGQNVTNLQNQMNQWNAQKPGSWQQGAAATAAQKEKEAWNRQKPGAYQQSDAVLQAQQNLERIQSLKPEGYNSRYADALDNILGQIQNPEKFQYSFNGDELFKQYADLYTQKGKQASLDTMGQAAALTGGYGNSYAQAAANQAYQQYLLGLYDKGMDLYDRAYQRWQGDRDNLYNQYNVLAQQDQTDYGRYRDDVGDWQSERDWFANRYDTERNFDYGQYRDTVSDWQNQRDYLADQYNTERNFDYGQYRDIVSDWQNQRDYLTGQYNTEADRDYNMYYGDRDYWRSVAGDENADYWNNRNFEWEQQQYQQNVAMDYVKSILANGQMPSDELLAQAGLSKADAQKLKAELAVAATGGGGGGGRGRKKSGTTTGNYVLPSDVIPGYDEVQKSNTYYDDRNKKTTTKHGSGIVRGYAKQMVK